MSSPAPSLSQKTGLEPNYPTPGPSVGALGALGALGTEPKCSWLASSETRVSKEPAGLDFEPAGLDLEPAGLGLKPVGLELEPAGLEFGPKLA